MATTKKRKPDKKKKVVKKAIVKSPPKKKAAELLLPDKIDIDPQQMLFVQYYTLPGSEYIGNATKAYMAAYEINCPVTKSYKDPITKEKDYWPQYKSAKSCAARLMTKANIQQYGQQLLLSFNNDNFVDSERMRTIAQNKDYASKVAAIRSYDELMGRLVKKFKFSGTVTPLLSKKQMGDLAGYVQKRLATDV